MRTKQIRVFFGLHKCRRKSFNHDLWCKSVIQFAWKLSNQITPVKKTPARRRRNSFHFLWGVALSCYIRLPVSLHVPLLDGRLEEIGGQKASTRQMFARTQNKCTAQTKIVDGERTLLLENKPRAQRLNKTKDAAGNRGCRKIRGTSSLQSQTTKGFLEGS